LSRFSLPVEECLDNLKRHLFERDEVILQAPPGAGKTTLVPLALLGEPWLANKKILMLEPTRPDRRLSHAPGIESQQSYPH
jgi:ATP-dependent helicase HrpB